MHIKTTSQITEVTLTHYVLVQRVWLSGMCDIHSIQKTLLSDVNDLQYLSKARVRSIQISGTSNTTIQVHKFDDSVVDTGCVQLGDT